MKLDEINIIRRRTYENIKKARHSNGLIIKTITNNYIRKKDNGVTESIGLFFYDVEFIKGYERMMIGIAENRLYFFPSNNKNDYKLTNLHKKYNDYRIVISGNNKEEIKRFVSDEPYTFHYDKECKGWWVSKNQ